MFHCVVVFFVYLLLIYKKKTWTIYFVYVSEVLGKTLQSLTSKSPRHQRELHLSFLIVSSNSPIVRNKNLKADVHPICP